MKFEDLTPEQREKLQACKTPEDIQALARDEGYDLTDEELEAASGAGWACFDNCPFHHKC